MRVFAGVILLFLVACTPVRVVSTETKGNEDFTKYRTYNFVEDNSGLESNPNFIFTLDAIRKELEQRGLTQSEDPDLLVNVAAQKEKKVQTRETDVRDAPSYMGTRNYYWESEEIVVGEYEEGTVKIDMVDASENKLVWQGIAAGTITGNEKKMKDRISKAIDAVFSKFPIKEK